MSLFIALALMTITATWYNVFIKTNYMSIKWANGNTSFFFSVFLFLLSSRVEIGRFRNDRTANNRKTKKIPKSLFEKVNTWSHSLHLLLVAKLKVTKKCAFCVYTLHIIVIYCERLKERKNINWKKDSS